MPRLAARVHLRIDDLLVTSIAVYESTDGTSRPSTLRRADLRWPSIGPSVKSSKPVEYRSALARDRQLAHTANATLETTSERRTKAH